MEQSSSSSAVKDPAIVEARNAYLGSCKELAGAIGSLEEAMAAFTGPLPSLSMRSRNRC